MKILHLMMGLLLVVGSGTAWAEFYKYRDANGVLRFTDDLSEVPVEQRQKVKAYQSVPATVTVTSEPSEQGAASPENADPVAQEDGLHAERIALEQEYEEITEANRRLKAEVEDPNNLPDPIEYNQKVKALDAKVKAYEARRKAFEDKVADHAAALKEQQ
jgi:hypothetical protein